MAPLSEGCKGCREGWCHIRLCHSDGTRAVCCQELLVGTSNGHPLFHVYNRFICGISAYNRCTRLRWHIGTFRSCLSEWSLSHHTSTGGCSWKSCRGWRLADCHGWVLLAQTYH